MKKSSITKIILINILVLIVFIGNTFAATIITGEKSNDNDEYDQKMEVNAGDKNSEKAGLTVDASTEEEAEEKKEEAYTLKKKIELELENQLDNMASSAKAEIYSVIYNKEDTIGEQIKEIWKQNVKTDISEEVLNKIIYKAENTLIEYDEAKIDSWFETYKVNNSDRIVNKVQLYIDEEENKIESGVAMVVYTAIDSINTEVNAISTKALESIPENVKIVLNRYIKISSWEEKAIDAVLTENDIQIKNALETGFKNKFNWEEEKLQEGFQQIATVTTEINNEFTNKTLDIIKNEYANKIGLNVKDYDFKSIFVKYGLSLFQKNLDSSWQSLNKMVMDKVLSTAERDLYNDEYIKIKTEKEKKANNEYSISIKVAKQEQDEAKRIEAENRAKKKLEEDLAAANREADEEARAKLSNKAIEEYNVEMKKMLNNMNDDAKSNLEKQADDLQAQIKKNAGDIWDQLKEDTFLSKAEETELEKKHNKNLEQIEINNGKKLSEEKAAEKEKKLTEESQRYVKEKQGISQKFPTELTQEQKNQKKLDKDVVKAESNAKETVIREKYGQQLSPAQKEELQNKLNAIDDSISESRDKIVQKYNKDNLTESEIKQRNQELKELDEKRTTDIANVQKEFEPTELTAEQKAQMKKELQEVADERGKNLKAVDEKYDELTTLNPANKAERERLLKEADKTHKENQEKINEEYKLPELTEEQKAKIKAEKEAENKRYKEEQEKAKQERRELKKKKQEEINKEWADTKKERTELNNWYNNTYKPEIADLKQQLKNPNLTKEQKKEIEKKIEEKEKEYKSKKQAIEQKEQAIREKEKSLLSSDQAKVMGMASEFLSELAGSYANELLTKLNDNITKWAEKLGNVGQAVVSSIMNRVQSWAVEQITNNVIQLVQGAFGITPDLGFKALKIDWGQMGTEVLWAWAMSNEKLAQILSGYGGFFVGTKSYEELAATNYAFISKGRTLIPSANFLSAIKVAEQYASQSRSLGDRGKLYSDTFGVKELMGYNECQFLPLGSMSIMLNLPPYTLVDNPTMVSPYLGPVPTGKKIIRYVLPIFRKNVTAGKVIPSYRIYSLPLVGPYYDSAYVACEFGQNAGNDSYVQRAFSYTSVALLGGGVPFAPTDYSEALSKEALKYSEFAARVTAAAGYKNTLKDLTDDDKLKVRYLDDRDWFIAGPFKVDYLKSTIETEERGRVDFGMMVDMKVYYKDTETGEEKEIPRDAWQLLFSENGEADIDFSTSRYQEEYIYPYPEEEFYICLDKSANPDITNISKIKMSFKEMQVAMYGQLANIEYSKILNTPFCWPVFTPHSGVMWFSELTRVPTAVVVKKNALFSVIYAKRYYLKWSFEITLNKKAQTTPAYETSDYVTSSTIKTVGTEQDDTLYGEEINSSLYDSVSTVVKNYTQENLDKYNTSGATFTESLSKISGVYTSADGDTAYIKSLNAILKAISENDVTKSLSIFSNITGSNNGDFQKVVQISKLASESSKMREVATLIDTIVDIYKNTNDNVGMLILDLLNETSIVYKNEDFSKVMDSVNEVANNCEYKLPVFALVAQSLNGTLTNEQMETFLKNNYSGLNEDKKALVTSTAKSIISTLSNSGDNGKNIFSIIDKAYNVFAGNINISDAIKTIVDNSQDNELQSEYRKFENILQINKKISEINNDETLSLAEKYKNIQEEQVKLYKAISVASIEMEHGSNLTDAIERAYGETSNIEKQVLSKFQNVVKDMSLQETESLVTSLSKSKDIENTLDIVNAEVVRNSLKGEEEKAKTFIDILQQNASLYDRTAYTEHDPKYNITKVERPSDVYYMGDDKVDLTMTIAGVVWKDGHTGLENDYDGVRTANSAGNIEKGIEGVQVTLIDSKTNKPGRMKVNGKWTDAITYTDEGGYYHFEKVESDKYYVQFTYDGHKYMPTTSLSDGTKRTVVSAYKQYSDLEMYDNNSKAIENETERIAFNDKFYDIKEDTAYSKNGEALSVNGQRVNLEYEEKDGVASLVTLDSAGHVLPQFAMNASTKELGITYPIDSEVTLDDETTETWTSQYLNPGLVYGEYKKTGEYMYHVNLGLVERSKLDLATTQDVYDVTTTVNEKQENYSYNQRGDLAIYDAKLKNTDAYKDITYTRELYNADYQLRLEDYSTNSLNKLDRNGNDKSSEIEKIKEVKTQEYANGGLEQRVFVTYKITLKNQSILQGATINEITDYFDPTYKLVQEDTYQNIQNAEGIAESKLVAKQSYFIVQSDNSATEYKLTWEETGMVNGLKSMNTVQTSAIGLEDVILRAQDEIYVFVTFEVDKDANRAIQLGKKQNIVEISSYTSIEVGANNKEHSIGLIDKDSAPDNITVGQSNTYEDDTDAAPVIELKLYSTDLRNVNGYVWNDDRTVKLSTGQIVGNGVREEKEELINGVRVELVEKVTDHNTGAEYEYVWKEMYTGEDNYKHIGSSGRVTNTERGQTISTGSVISDTNLGAVQKGEYKFHDYIAGNFIVRFIYGDTYKTYLAKDSENTEGQGLNETSYNGEDYKSTAYLKGNNLYAKWYDLSGFDKEDKLYSDAKDDTTRRNKVIEYTSTLQNDKAEILASFDNRKDKYYYNTKLHQSLRDNTWMFADTAKINVNVEYNTTKSNGLSDKTYKIKNIDFGLEKRPETKIELTKEITDITIKLASGDTIINTAAGMSQNVNWTANKKNAIKGNNYKRDNLRYEYRQGRIHIYMDEEVMQGASIQITYKITVTNNSEIDYTGKDGNLGYTYFTGQVSSSDKIVTTTVNKIIDYVDNSLTFRKTDSPDWSLIETMREFTTTSTGAQVETKKMDYGEFIEKMMAQYGEGYVAKNLTRFEAMFKVYQQTGQIQDFGTNLPFNGINQNKNNTLDNPAASVLSNYNVIQNMKDRKNSIGYLNEDISLVKTKSAKTTQEPITQVIVTKALENKALKPGESASVELKLSKTLSPEDEDDTLNYGNMAEILQYSNTVGRRDMDAIPGNQEPDEDPYEYDTDYTERVLITPPTGANRAYYFVLGTVVLVILAGGIILIKKKVIDKK